MKDFTTDLRFAWRSLWKNPALTAIAVAALALGIGANTAIFSVVYGVLLRPLPFPEPDRVIRLIDTNPSANLPRFSTAPPDFADWRAENQVFSQLAAVTRDNLNLTGDGEPERLQGARVSGDFFAVLGTKPLLGRPLLPAEDIPGGPKVAVLSYKLWQRRFGGDKGIVNRRLILNGESTLVAGVMPAAFDVPGRTEIWVPLQLVIDESQRGGHYLSVFGRLKPGVSIEQAQTEMNGVTQRIARTHPQSNEGWGVNLIKAQDLMVEDVRPRLLLLLGAVGLVLLIACANVANLLLSRLAAREREVALRSALGAGRGRLVRQFLTESTMLSLVGGLLGIVLAWRGTPLLVALYGTKIPRAGEIGVDATVLAFTLGLSLVTGLLFGLLPALHSSNPDLQSSLRDGGKGHAGDRRGRRTRSVLVFGEVALAIVVLVVASLLVRSLRQLQDVSPGFRSDHALSVQLQLPETSYKEEPKQVAFYRSLVPKLAALPGVTNAAIGYPLPFSGGRYLLAFSAEGQPPPKTLSDSPAANMGFVSPEYFATLGIPIREGRVFSDGDAIGGEGVVVVNRALAAKIWPGRRALGQRVTFGDPTQPDVQWLRVVGVVADIRHADLKDDPGLQAYLPLYQSPNAEVSLIVRTSSEPGGLTAAVARVVHEADPGLPIANPKSLDQLLADSVAEPRANAILLSMLALLALVLAAVGIYGVLSYSVSQRTREIGLRMALGAGSGQVRGQMVREGLATVLAGIVAGLVGAFFLARTLQSLLYGVKVNDPLTFLGVPILLLAVAFLATWLPARRATRVEPVVALRYE